jgi:hypothetical protein
MRLTWRSRDKITEAHKKGATVGHGAKLATRDLLPDLSEADVQVLKKMLVEDHLIPASEGES